MESSNDNLLPLSVEECFKLTLNHLGKRLLYPVNDDRKFLVYEDISALEGSTRMALLTRHYGFDVIFMSFQVIFQPLRIDISYDTESGRTYGQSIPLETDEIAYGTRSYMLCSCGTRHNTLYLRPDMPHYFACRHCLNLFYELTTINRTTSHGNLFYLWNRKFKLTNMQCDIRRLHYRSKYTRRANQCLVLSKKMTLARLRSQDILTALSVQ